MKETEIHPSHCSESGSVPVGYDYIERAYGLKFTVGEQVFLAGPTRAVGNARSIDEERAAQVCRMAAPYVDPEVLSFLETLIAATAFRARLEGRRDREFEMESAVVTTNPRLAERLRGRVNIGAWQLLAPGDRQ